MPTAPVRESPTWCRHEAAPGDRTRSAAGVASDRGVSGALPVIPAVPNRRSGSGRIARFHADPTRSSPPGLTPPARCTGIQDRYQTDSSAQEGQQRKRRCSSAKTGGSAIVPYAKDFFL